MKQLKAILGGIGAFVIFAIMLAMPIPAIFGLFVYLILIDSEPPKDKE